MSIAVFISRILGLVREQVFASLFGAGMASDGYLVAFRIPGLLRDLFAEGALSLSFVTVFNKAHTDEERKRVARTVMTALSLIVGLVCLGIGLSASTIVGNTAEHFALEPGKLELTVGLTRLFSPFLYFASMAALAMGILNSLGSFFIPSMGSAAFNLGNIVVGGGLAWYLRDSVGPEAAIWGFGVGTLVGGFLQWSIQWPSLRKNGYSPWAGARGVFSWAEISTSFKDPGFRKVIFLMAPAVLSIASVQITNYVGILYASSLPQGSVSWINYSFRLMHFPMGVFGVALSTAAHPKLATLLRDGKHAEFETTLEQALMLSWIMAFGSAVGLAIFREPLLSLIYEHGRFTRLDTVMTGQALLAYSVGLVFFITSKILVQAFYALNRVWVSSVLSVISIGLSVVFNHVFSKIYGHAGVPLSTSLTSAGVVVAFMIALRVQKIKFISSRSRRPVFAALCGGGLMASVMLFDLPGRLLVMRDTLGFVPFAVATLGSIAVAGSVYLGVVSGLTPEGRLVWNKVSARFRRRA